MEREGEGEESFKKGKAFGGKERRFCGKDTVGQAIEKYFRLLPATDPKIKEKGGKEKKTFFVRETPLRSFFSLLLSVRLGTQTPFPAASASSSSSSAAAAAASRMI